MRVTMSYVSPPESRSRVEIIKKKFEIINNDLSSSATSNTYFTKTSVNRNVLGNKAQPNNGFKSSVSPRKKILHSVSSDPIDSPKKLPNPSPSIKPPPNGQRKAERQVSSACGRVHIRRSPAFRCDKIVRGRNVIGQMNGISERTRSLVNNRVKQFEDGQSVKSVVKKLNVLPLVPSDAAAVSDKSSRSQIQWQLALGEDDATKMTALKSGNSVAVRHVTENHLVDNPGTYTNFTDKAIISNRTDLEKTETVPQHKLAKSGSGYGLVSKVQVEASPSFLHKYVNNRAKFPLQNKQFNSNHALENFSTVRNVEQKELGSHANLMPVPSRHKVNNSKGPNDVECVKGQALQDTLQEGAGSSDMILTDTLKSALKAPLPSGPPPKKPPRTFAHNTPSPDNAGQHIVSMPSAIEPVSNKDSLQQVKFTNSASEKTVRPIRSKTESQIILKKLERVLLNHQQGDGGVVLRPRSPAVKKHVKDKATVTYSEPESNTRKPVGRVGPLPNLPLERELLSSHKTSAVSDNLRFGGCLNFNCVSPYSDNHVHPQFHVYEKVPEKQSEFFVASPKNYLLAGGVSKPYGTLLRCKARSEEHIYAEPFDYADKTHMHRHKVHDRKSPQAVMKSGESVGDLCNMGASVRKFQNQMSPSLHPKNTSRRAALHYLCTPLHTNGIAEVAENGMKARNNEPKKSESIVPTVAGRQVSNNSPQILGTESANDEWKKPPLLRLAALVRGGQTSGFTNVAPNNVERLKIQLLMNQAFGTPVKGLPTSSLDQTGSDSDSLASTPDDGGFSTIFQKLEAESVGEYSPDTNRSNEINCHVVTAGMSAARCADPTTDGDDSSSTNSAEQQELLTQQAEERKVYVRRVSSIAYRRACSCAPTPSAFPHLFQCVLLVGLNLDPSDKKTKVPYIKTQFPLDADVPPHIEKLCFPDAADWPPPPPPSQPSCGGNDEQSYSLVITSDTGVRRFGYCRRVQPEGSSLCLPLAYCIISPFRASGFYYKILAELESRHGEPECLQTAFIKQLYSCHFPGPGQSLRLSMANTSHSVAGSVCNVVLTVRRPRDSRLEERDLAQLFSALCVPALLKLFSSLLLERKVILISNSLSRLSSCVEALQSILYPFSWQHTLIPVLPTSLLDICLSPTPYIVGILRGRDATALPGPIDDGMVIMVDLDEKRVLQCVGDEMSILPLRLRRCLKLALQLVTNTTQPWDASRNVLVSEAFVRMFVEVCGHYRNHVVTQQDSTKIFERESFIKAVASQSIRSFLEWFTETALFSAFIESRVESESDVTGMFEQRCLEHSEEMESNTKVFLKNYKMLNKKVKTFDNVQDPVRHLLQIMRFYYPCTLTLFRTLSEVICHHLQNYHHITTMCQVLGHQFGIQL